MNARQRLTKLERVARSLKGHSSIVASQIDPDACGAAVGMEFLLRKAWGVETYINYTGSISHAQNRALFNWFGLNRLFASITTEQLLDGRNIILVDSSSTNDRRLGLKGDQTIDPIIVVDHHRDSTLSEGKQNFILIEDVGAASTLVTQLIHAARLSFEEADQHIPLLLALGIYSDTNHLVDATDTDFRAFDWLRRFYSQSEFKQILNYPLQPSHFANLDYALQHQYTKGSRLLSCAGIIKPEDGDDLAVIADLLFRKVGISLSVVWALMNDDSTIRLSARNRDISLALADFLQRKFNSGGAKVTEDGKSIGGAQFPIEILVNRKKISGKLLLNAAAAVMKHHILED